MKLSELNRRRLANFRANRRGFWSLWIFLALFGLSLASELVANDQPILVRYDGQLFVPFAKSYPETAFGGEFETRADYRDPAVEALIDKAKLPAAGGRVVVRPDAPSVFGCIVQTGRCICLPAQSVKQRVLQLVAHSQLVHCSQVDKGG
jgi:hypothetical protein